MNGTYKGNVFFSDQKGIFAINTNSSKKNSSKKVARNQLTDLRKEVFTKGSQTNMFKNSNMFKTSALVISAFGKNTKIEKNHSTSILPYLVTSKNAKHIHEKVETFQCLPVLPSIKEFIPRIRKAVDRLHKRSHILVDSSDSIISRIFPNPLYFDWKVVNFLNLERTEFIELITKINKLDKDRILYLEGFKVDQISTGKTNKRLIDMFEQLRKTCQYLLKLAIIFEEKVKSYTILIKTSISILIDEYFDDHPEFSKLNFFPGNFSTMIQKSEHTFWLEIYSGKSPDAIGTQQFWQQNKHFARDDTDAYQTEITISVSKLKDFLEQFYNWKFSDSREKSEIPPQI